MNPEVNIKIRLECPKLSKETLLPNEKLKQKAKELFEFVVGKC